jgi:hypothetical protein
VRPRDVLPESPIRARRFPDVGNRRSSGVHQNIDRVSSKSRAKKTRSVLRLPDELRTEPPRLLQPGEALSRPLLAVASPALPARWLRTAGRVDLVLHRRLLPNPVRWWRIVTGPPSVGSPTREGLSTCLWRLPPQVHRGSPPPRYPATRERFGFPLQDGARTPLEPSSQGFPWLPTHHGSCPWFSPTALSALALSDARQR